MSLEAKPEYAIDSSPVSSEKEAPRRGSVAVGEAADIYGDIQTAEQYGYVERGLKSRHIQFIALGQYCQ